MSFKRIVLLDGKQNATAVGASFSVQTGTMGILSLEEITVTGTTPKMDAYLQGSDDDGTIWYDLPADQILKTDASAPGEPVLLNSRNVNGPSSMIAAGKWVAIYKHLPSKHVRLAWVISGTFAAGEGFDTEATLDLK